jgi:hypothetical protein
MRRDRRREKGKGEEAEKDAKRCSLRGIERRRIPEAHYSTDEKKRKRKESVDFFCTRSYLINDKTCQIDCTLYKYILKTIKIIF